jgi:hypothetical protein
MPCATALLLRRTPDVCCTHDRLYRLLAERVRLGDAARRALHATMTALIGTGIWWLLVRYGDATGAATDELSRVAREALAMKFHGAAAFATLFALGAMSAQHARRGWALRRNRASGSLLAATFALLVLTGYALYYLAGESAHAPVSALHWLGGLTLAPMLALHIAFGRGSRGGAADARGEGDRRGGREGAPHGGIGH